MFEKAIGIIVIIILLLIVVKYWYSDFIKKRQQRKRFDRGAKLENDARAFLVKKGYKIVEEQFKAVHRFKVDGEVEEVKIIVDYLVSKKGKIYLVEVKSGKSAIYIKNKNTRRQILEYDYSIENDGIFLLDMENEKMHLIEFIPKEKIFRFRILEVAIIVCLIVAFIPFWYVKVIATLLVLGVLGFTKNLNI